MQRIQDQDTEGLVFDDEEEEDVSLATLAGAQPSDERPARTGPGEEGDGAEDVKLLKRSKRQRPKFTETDLMGPKGLEWVLHNFPRMLRGSVRGRRGSEMKDLDRIMQAYTAWARQVHQHLHADDVLDRTQGLSSRACVKSLMDTLRAQLEERKADAMLDVQEGSEAAKVEQDGGVASPLVRQTAAPKASPGSPAVTPMKGAAATAEQDPPEVGDADIEAAMLDLQATAGITAEEEALAAEMAAWDDDF